MNDKKYREIALRQYSHIPTLLKKHWNSDTALQILNHLIDINDMNWEDIEEEIAIADEKLANAFSKTDNIWLEQMQKGMIAVQLENASWWKKILKTCKNLQGGTKNEHPKPNSN
jgi:hypothetical protein